MKKLTQEYLKERLTYIPETGIFTWKERPVHHFSDNRLYKKEDVCRRWNTKHSNKQAGSLIKRGYQQITIDKKAYRSQKLSWLYMTNHYPIYPKEEIDHINRVRHDNRWKNLRLVGRTLNCQNRGISKLNKSGVTGVFLDKRNNKWKSGIYINNKYIYLGHFNIFNDGVIARYNEEQNNPLWVSTETSAEKYLKENNLLVNK